MSVTFKVAFISPYIYVCSPDLPIMFLEYYQYSSWIVSEKLCI